MTSTRPPTIHDVAARSGMSRGTVSRYLNGGKNVSADASRAIEDAIRQSGYRVNSLARSLRNSRTDCVAFLLLQPMDVLFSDPVHGVLARACSAALARRGLAMVMVMAGDSFERERARSFLRSGHVDGVLAVGTPPTDAAGFEVADLGLPVVFCGHHPPRVDSGISVVASDSHAAFRDAVRMLRERGRRSIAFLGGTNPLDETALRLAGYRDGMGELTDEALVAVPRSGTQSAAASVRELLGRATPDALVCVNDVAAAEAIRELQSAGLRVPTDVAVVGFDNIETICTSTDPALTSIAQDFDAIAESMAHLLSQPPADVVIPTRLVVRESA